MDTTNTAAAPSPYTHDRFEAHAEQLATLVTKENGKKLAE